MATIDVSIEIDAPVDRLWAALESIESHVTWMADAESIAFSSEQTRGVGTSFVCATKVGPIRVSDEMTITEWIPGARIGVRHRGIVTGRGRFEIEPLDLARRSRLVWTESIEFPLYLGGPIGGAVAQVVLAKIWRRNLARLRKIIERTGVETQ